MSLRIWALKPAELKPLTPAGRLLFSARPAMRVAPWRPEAADDPWNEAPPDRAPAAARAAIVVAAELNPGRNSQARGSPERCITPSVRSTCQAPSAPRW
jgi:hypothetical protein